MTATKDPVIALRQSRGTLPSVPTSLLRGDGTSTRCARPSAAPAAELAARRLGQHHLVAVANRGVEAARPAGVAGGSGLVDDQEQAVAVAVDAELEEPLALAGGRALAPQLAPRARPVGDLAGPQRFGEALGVHPREHQHRARAGLGDRRDQAIRVEPEGRAVEAGIVRPPFSACGFRPIYGGRARSKGRAAGMSADDDLIKLYSQRILALAADIPLTGRLQRPGASARRRCRSAARR